MSDVITATVKCRSCKDSYAIEVREAHLVAWQSGMLIQNAMPYLTADERELLISQTCNKCFADMFPIDDKPYCGDCIKPVSSCHHKGDK